MPAYFSPYTVNGKAQWERLIPNTPPPPLATFEPTLGMVVINPQDTLWETVLTPAAIAEKQAYFDLVSRARRAGVKVLGYVDTSYTRTAFNPAKPNDSYAPLTTIRTKINAFLTDYHVHGIFFDQVRSKVGSAPGLTDYLKYYADRKQEITDILPTAIIALNHGVYPDEGYVNVGNIHVTFEGYYNNPDPMHPELSYSNPNHVVKDWVRNYPASRFWHLVHTTDTSAKMRDAVKKSKERHAGWVYVTPDMLPNRWDNLPSPTYWSDELQAVASPLTPPAKLP